MQVCDGTFCDGKICLEFMMNCRFEHSMMATNDPNKNDDGGNGNGNHFGL